MRPDRRIFYLALLALLALLGGCAAQRTAPAPAPLVSTTQPVPGVWLFRHKVSLDFPARALSQSFDGMLRLDPAAKTAQVVATGGLGMLLFDVRLGPDTARAVYLHPALEKIPRLTEHIAACVRRIWFDCLALIPQNMEAAGDGWIFSASGGRQAGLWPSHMRLTDTQAGYTLTIRLLHAQREETP